VATVPGLAVAGAPYEGIGIPACIASADRAVAGLSATLSAA
jgi:oxygen-dependent protoporphyrinogen oxidase